MCAVQTISAELEEGDPRSLRDLLAGLPWLLVRYKAALKRLQPAEAAKASKQGAENTNEAALAEFAMFALLLQLLMDPAVATSRVSRQITL